MRVADKKITRKQAREMAREKILERYNKDRANDDAWGGWSSPDILMAVLQAIDDAFADR